MSALSGDACEVFDFWFAPVGSPEHGTARAVWFRKDPAFDALIRQRFGGLVERALNDELHDWQATPESALARVLLLDQFTRNIFRDSARAFAGDRLALAAARTMVASGQDTALPPHPRSFVYLPFEHAEDLAAQDDAVRLFAALEAQMGEPSDMLDYAQRHRVIIERFGRFPHRNALLGRESTPEEAAFLRQPGSGF